MGSKYLQIKDADKVTIWVVTDNYYDANRPDKDFAKRYRAYPGHYIHAEHGLSFFIKTETAEKNGACMFDFGMDHYGVSNNIKLLGLNVASADAFALSHGHFDHYLGAKEILDENREGIKDGTPFYTGKEAFLHRYSLRPGAEAPVDIGRLEKTELESSGVKVIEVSEPMEFIPGGYLSGDIERTTSYEKPAPNLIVKRGNEMVPDSFSGEQSVFFNIKDKGLVILSGCAHAGIVNTVKHIQGITGIKKVHAVMGGFHLINAGEEKIKSTVEDIKAINPDIIIPLHCTGFEAVTAIMAEMPDAFFLNTAGTKYIF